MSDTNIDQIFGDATSRVLIRKMIANEITAMGRKEIREQLNIVLGELLSRKLDIKMSMTDFIKNEIRTYLNVNCRAYMFEQMKNIALDIMSRAYNGLKNEN